ncbi:MAG TPA: IPT/TIG domain-containing protein, partial [Candidatus Acidoferrales bacterium]|nr:IPT/TIG domain-containing protein [Candidatus Acidoferrales bacterium]
MQSYAQAPTITSISPSSGAVGSEVEISGTSFGPAQDGSTVSLNGTNATVVSWTDTAIGVVVPTGSSSGSFSVTVNGQNATSSSFAITQLPSSWSDTDVGSVGISGTATFANGVFTVNGSGTGISGTSDQMNFAYQPLSGDGSIVARLATATGSNVEAAIVIRETLNANATFFDIDYRGSRLYVEDRTSTGATASANLANTYLSSGLPYWVKVQRSGSTFSAYISPDGMNWTQLGSSQTITMAQDAYVGLVVSSDSNSALATETSDSVSISSTASPMPTITGLSPTAGLAGSQVTISGSSFGASEDGSLATLNGAPLQIDSWSDTAIVTTVPTGALSGPIVVSVAPSMNDSNPMSFQLATQPLASWLDLDIGSVPSAGNASYSNGVFTVNGAGQIGGTSDAMHFVYEPLSGDGSIVARVVSLTGSSAVAGVMIRETLNSNASDADAFYWPYDRGVYFYDRPSTGANPTNQGSVSMTTLPYWVKLVRSGNTFSAYASRTGLYWTQLGSSQTITMAQNVYVGLWVDNCSSCGL